MRSPDAKNRKGHSWPPQSLQLKINGKESIDLLKRQSRTSSRHHCLKTDPVLQLLNIQKDLSIAPSATTLPAPKKEWLKRYGDTPSRSLVKCGKSILKDCNMEATSKYDLNMNVKTEVADDVAQLENINIPPRTPAIVRLKGFARKGCRTPNIQDGIGPWTLSNNSTPRPEGTPRPEVDLPTPTPISPAAPDENRGKVRITVPVLKKKGASVDRSHMSLSLIVNPPTPNHTGWAVFVNEAPFENPSQWNQLAPPIGEIAEDNVLDLASNETLPIQVRILPCESRSRSDFLKYVIEKALTLPVSLVNGMINFVGSLFIRNQTRSLQFAQPTNMEVDNDIVAETEEEVADVSEEDSDSDDSTITIKFIKKFKTFIVKEESIDMADGNVTLDISDSSDTDSDSVVLKKLSFSSCSPTICETDELRFEDLSALDLEIVQHSSESESE